MFQRLKNKVVFISGASAGIGQACAKYFLDAGCKVVMGARRASRLKLSLDSWNASRPGVTESALLLDLDVRDKSSCERFIEKGIHRFGSIDILVNNAGLALGRDPVSDLREDELKTMFETNVYGVFSLTQAALRIMIKENKGHIITLGSVAGYMSYAGGSAYCATKFSVRAFSEALRYELLGKAIRVSLVSPGLVETEFSDVRFKGNTEKAKEVYQRMTPLTADDIAECVVFVASRPPHVDIDDLIIRPTEQAGLTVFRKHE